MSTQNNFTLRVLSRHPSSRPLRNSIIVPGKKVVYRHGSTTLGNFDYELNSVESVKISSNKRRMKEMFDKAGIRHAKWIPMDSTKKQIDDFIKSCNFPKNYIIIKNINGSRGTGNYLIKNHESLESFIKNKSSSKSKYIIEQFKRYLVEYRIHVDANGYFYTCRKLLRSDVPENKKFQRHDDNCVWIVEENPKFDKPENWNDIVSDCVKALKEIGADILAFDVKCTSILNKEDRKCDWIVIESCSAPSFGERTLMEYKKRIPETIKNKYDENKRNKKRK